MDLTTVAVALISASVGIFGTWAIILRTRTEAATAAASVERSDRLDVVTMLTSEVNYWREQAKAEREQAEEWRNRYYQQRDTTEAATAALERAVGIAATPVVPPAVPTAEP